MVIKIVLIWCSGLIMTTRNLVAYAPIEPISIFPYALDLKQIISLSPACKSSTIGADTKASTFTVGGNFTVYGTITIGVVY